MLNFNQSLYSYENILEAVNNSTNSSEACRYFKKKHKSIIYPKRINLLIKDFDISTEHFKIIERGEKLHLGLVGRKIWKLTIKKVYPITVIKENEGKKRKIWYADCECECGKFKEGIKCQCILNGVTSSCGCLRSTNKINKNIGKESKIFRGIEDMSIVYYPRIKRRCIEKNLEFDLDQQFMWDLFIKQNKKCAISGLDIVFASSNKDKRNGLKTTASLDRIDSKKSYTKDNVQWVHKHVNFMKQAYSQSYFINLCKIIADNNKET